MNNLNLICTLILVSTLLMYNYKVEEIIQLTL